MRIGVDALNLRADRRGMGRVVAGVLDAAKRRPGIELVLIARNAGGLEAFGLPVVSVRAAGKRGRFDAVWYPWNGIRFAVRAPALVTIYDAFAFDEPARGLVARLREQRPIRRAVRRADRIATISQWSRARVAVRLGVEAARIALTIPAPDPLFVPGDEPSPLERPFVLFVGGPERRKNAGRFLAAYARAFSPGGDRPVLAIAGTLESAAEARLAGDAAIDAVRLSPDDATLRALYRNAVAVAVPSLAEGYGLVAAEAQACGAAVIASDASALPEVVGDAALLVPPTDERAWAAALRAVTDDAELRDGLRAKAAARHGFAARDQGAQATLDLLAGLVR